MTAQVWKVLSWVGLVLLAVGLLVGLLPLSSQGEGCGSAFRAANPFLTPPSCDDIRSLVRIPAVVLLVLGAGLTITSAMQWSDSRARDENAREGQAQG